MPHLSQDQLIEGAEGTLSSASVAHLEGCGICKKELDGLRAALSMVADDQVPEPSPIFWDHFAEQVGAAVRRIESPPRAWWVPGWWMTVAPQPRAIAAAAGVVTVVLVMLLTARVGWRQSASTLIGTGGGQVAADAAPLGDDDPSLAVMIELARDVDLEAVGEAGLPTRLGGADGMISQLSGPERRELDRLLREALAKPGA